VSLYEWQERYVTEEVDEWLPWVHVVISNPKRFPLGTCCGGVRRHRLQEHTDEFVYRFNPVALLET
jgi:hypothetical protein